MKFAILESVVTPGGHEIDYDRILVEELTALGHAVEFYVPEGHEFKWNYGVPVHHLPGKGVSYAGARGFKKLCLSAKREYNRRRWCNKMYQYAVEKRFDAIIFPSATYRYLRGLQYNQLLKATVPVIYMIHGLTPEETTRLFEQAEQVVDAANIKIAVQTFAPDALQTKLPNISYFPPPAYIPRDIEYKQYITYEKTLRLGFFGQYRKEKNLDAFLDAYFSCDFSSPVKLIVQGATQTPGDAEDFERIINKYSGQKEKIEFIHKPLIGKEWQAGIQSVDAIVMPYSNPRYRYHTSAMLSTAIGFYKPIIISDMINPEVLEEFKIGIGFDGSSAEHLKKALEEFVNTFEKNKEGYEQELRNANEKFLPKRLAENIVTLAAK